MRFALLPLLVASLAYGQVEAKVSITTRRIEVPLPPRESPEGHLRVDTSLVVIPTFATTERGGSVMGLKPENFRLFEDGVEQSLTYFAADDAPVSIGLVFDSSGSMHNKMSKSLEAVAELLKTANREDEFFLIDFNEHPKLSVPFTNDTEAVYRMASRTRVFGRTTLYDAVHMALEQMKQAKLERKAIIVISDGGDNRSHYTFGEIKSDLLESGVQLYTIGILEPEEKQQKLSPEERKGPAVLEQLSEESGGRFFPVIDVNELPSVSESLGLELRNQYLLGYSPAQLVRDGKYHKLRVELLPPDGLVRARLFYRKGYYSPMN
jgi:VWFA-related protein